uniref:Uncharacterized protein n=1 Tax=Rhizophagus irregularis (strain DAOM 181602 / DAOM 197198 / MUCL 43194) TaxID=747089 RepID=U9T8B6_RHIID
MGLELGLGCRIKDQANQQDLNVKYTKCEAGTQLTNTDLNNVVKLSDRYVYDIDNIKDSLAHHENEVSVKRIKHTNISCEKGDIDVNGNTGGRKCDICHKTGH